MKETLAEQLSRLTGKDIPQKQIKKNKKKVFPAINKAQLVRGSIVYLPLSAEEGLIITDGYEERNKFIVIVGLTADGFVIGSLLINTNANNATKELGNCQFPLYVKDYQTILDYNSWLDCSQLFRISCSKVLASGQYCGAVTQRDWDLVLPFLIENEAISNREKKEFGIL